VDKQHRFGAHAAYKSQQLAVAGKLGPHRAAIAGYHVLHLPRAAVYPADHVDQAVGVFVVFEGGASAHVLAEVNVAAVGRGHGLAGILLVVFAPCQLDAAAAADVVSPHLTGP
jgi:hypothetical protein